MPRNVIQYTPEQADVVDHLVVKDGIVLVEAGAGCVDKDTEFLTPTGWKFISDYTEDDLVAQWNQDSSIKFVKPLGYIKAESDTLHHIKSNTVDMVVSDEHRVPYITDKGTFTVKHFSEIKNFGKLKIPRTYESVIGDSCSSISNELLQVLVMQSADGSHIKNIKQFKIRINVKKYSKKTRVIKLLDNAGIPFSMVKAAEGYLTVSYYPPKEIAFKGLGSLWNCSDEQLKIVGQEATFWDGCLTKRTNVVCPTFTGNKVDAELVQHAWHILTGNYVTLTKDPREYKKEDLYTVQGSSRSVSDLTFRSSRDRKLSTITPYKTTDGFKYCFTTPSTFWLARRNGKVFPTGNSGKSFMSRQIVQELPITSGIYTAFNKAIVEEGVDRFAGTPIQCKTLHALAYQYVKPTMEIKSFSYKCIKEKISYTEKRKIIEVIDTFYVSASTDMYDYFEEVFEGHSRKDYMINLATKYVQGMADGDVNPTFNFLLKSLHLMLAEKTVSIKVDIVILDEINDVTAVSLAIFRLIDAPKKLGLGETHQAIYQFLNLVNGFEVLADEATTMRFTQSYRCSTDIAQRIETCMQDVMDPNFRFKGTDKPVTNGKTLYCTLTNAMIIDKLQSRLATGKGFTLLRRPADIFAAPMAVLTASGGKKPYQSKYHYLVDVYDDFKKQSKYKTYFKFLLAELNDEEINNAVKLLQRLSSENINIFSLYNEVKNAKPDKNYTVATVFTSKGLEFETVFIADDLNTKFESACKGELDEEETITAFRLYYVGCSRAGVNLLNSVL